MATGVRFGDCILVNRNVAVVNPDDWIRITSLKKIHVNYKYSNMALANGKARGVLCVFGRYCDVDLFFINRCPHRWVYLHGLIDTTCSAVMQFA